VWGKLPLRMKLTILVTTVVSVAAFAFLRFAAVGLVDLMEKAAGQGAVSAAEGMASNIDGAWFASTDLSDSEGPRYQELSALLNKVINQSYIHRVEVVRFAGKASVEHVFSIPEDRSPDYYVRGTREDLMPGTPYLINPYGHSGYGLSQPGAYTAGWASIFNGGQRVGVLIVIVDASEVQRALNNINIALVVVLLTLILLSGILAYKSGASFEKTAVTDGLMGIYNHKYFKQRLEQEVARARRYGQLTSLVLADLDHFKRVNDTYGHATGDIVLKNLAKWVTDTARNTDVVCRYGGEEIAIILPHTGVAGAQEFAERLRMKVAQQIVRDPEEDAEFRVTVSVGVAQWEHPINMIDLIKRADAALYHSKDTGRNRVTIYQEEILPAPESQAGPKTASR